MLATQLLASGITHLTDARYFAAWEVDYLAFPLGEKTDGEAISLDMLNALREWIEGPAIVAELGDVDEGSAWATTLQTENINIALVASTAPASAHEELSAAGVRVISHVKVAGYQSADDVTEAIKEHSSAELILLDFESGGITWTDIATGTPFSLDSLRELLAIRPCLLQIDTAGNDPVEIKEAYPLTGFAVRGSSEEKVGYKSFDDLDDLFEGLEVFE